MNADDARRATRYAVNELNGFPDWFTSLAAAHPDAVREILAECVVGEWAYPSDRSQAFDVLADLAWIGGSLGALVVETLLDLLRHGDPANLDILTFALSVLLKVGVPGRDLVEIAMNRCRSLSTDDARLIWWMTVALQFDASEATAILGRRLTECPGADDIVVRIAALLESRARSRLPQIADPSFLAPTALRDLIPLVYAHIREADDLDRMGKGAYTPTARDEAQDLRNSLLSRLAQSPSPEASAVLRDLLTEPTLAGHRDWIRHLLDQRRWQDAERQPWEPADIRSFASEYETDPKTAQNLFAIVLNRLSDIQHDVERSDNSLREEVAESVDEYVLRRWLARKLNERSRERYTVPQEEEIDQKQRPDLRVENPKTHPVSIEVKWADNWTLQELLERLESQLVGQYLRAHHSRHGIYLLASDGRKRHWQDGDGKRITFEEVSTRLTAKAAEIEAENTDVDVVRVVSIDFRRPGTS